jgi:hypothetical protein
MIFFRHMTLIFYKRNWYINPFHNGYYETVDDDYVKDCIL